MMELGGVAKGNRRLVSELSHFPLPCLGSLPGESPEWALYLDQTVYLR